MLNTKHDEIIIKTANPEEMINKFFAERVLKSWMEDFVDEDTGDVVSIERNEVLFEKGVFIDANILSELNFFIQSGDVTEVSVTNQPRKCVFTKNSGSVWSITSDINNKKKTLYLYATNINTAIDIAKDFIEQSFSGVFTINSVKSDGSIFLVKNIRPAKDELTPEDKDSNCFYKIKLLVTDTYDDSRNAEFLLKSTNADEAKAIAEAFLTKNCDEFKETTIITAKQVSCDEIIDLDFCEKYNNKL